MTEFIQLMAQYPLLFASISFFLATVIGSFLNVVIHRLPVMMKREWQLECNQYLDEYHKATVTGIKDKLAQPIDDYPEKYNLIVPGSSCPKCKTSIKPWHNLPILGWLILGGKCIHCKTHISARYPIIEALTGMMVAYLAYHFGPSWQFAFGTILTFGLIALTGIDLDEMLLPDQITLPLLWIGLLINLNGTFVSITDAVIGATAGYMSLWSVFWGFKLLTGKEGMGYGDFKLLAMFGAWLGWQQLPLIILLSSIVGATVGLILIVTNKTSSEHPIPFGPYLSFAGWISLVSGPQLTLLYMSYVTS